MPTTVIKGGASAPVPVATVQTTGYGTTTSILVREVGPKLLYLDPASAPFTLLTERAGSQTASNPKYEWYEKALRPKNTQVNNGGGYTDVDPVTMTVDDGLVFQVNDIVFIPATGEVARVSASAATTVTLTGRGIGSTTATTMSDNDDIFVIGSANVEGGDVGVPDEWGETQKFNYTQIFRRPFGATRTREASESYFGKTRPRLRAEKAIEHAIDLERAFMFGYKAETSSANSVWRTTGGFIEFATENPLDLSGSTLTEPDLEGWMEDVFAHTASGDSRVLFGSAQVISAFDQLGTDRVRLVPSDKTLGLTVRQFLTSHGTFNIIKHRLLEFGLGGDGYGDYAFVVDPKMLKMRTLSGGSTKLLIDRQQPGADGWIDEYLTETGLQLTNPEVHGILKNVGASV
jgi:hypothetical protein